MNIQSDIKVQYYDSSLTLKTRCTIPITEDALVHYELMQSHYCKCSFRCATPIAFGIGDFIDTSFGQFELIEDVKPKDDGNVGFGYELQFEAYYYKFKNKQLKYLPSSTSPELAFNLTSSIETHAQIIIDNLKALAEKGKTNLYDVRYTGEGTDYVFAIDSTVDKKKAKLISYSNLNIIDAIALIAQTFECEWWFEGNIIHFGTCENENAVTDFVEDDNIVSLSGSQSQSTYANRVYGFGSTKNIPTNYYKDAAVDVTKHGVVERRLMLPTTEECSVENQKLLEDNGFELKEGYIQVKGLSEDQYKEGIATDEDIYPKNLIKTDKITSYEKEVEDDSTTEEGDYIKRTFYRVENLTIVNEDGEKTGDMAFREAYKLSGQNLHIVFQSGSLSGLDFECEFNPDGVSEVIIDENGKPILVNGKEQINPESQVFEIILNEDYGRPLPDNILKPKAGDTFVLYNWDASKLGKTLVVAASNELLKSVVKSVKKSMIDPTTFTCTADSNYSFNNGNGRFHSLGDRIRLLVKSLGNKVRESRIIGFEMHLDIPFDSVKYIVGEKPSYSRFASLDSKIEELEMNGNTYQGKGGSGSTIYIIKSYDRVLPTDYNVYSAKAVNEQRLNKLKDDTAQGFITFLKGLKAQDVIKAINGMSLGNGESYVNGNGDAKLADVVVDRIHDKNSTPSDRVIIGAQGFDLYMGDDGKSHLFVDYLTARTRMFASSVEIRKVSYSGGTTIFSNAGSQIAKVSYIWDAAKEKVIAYKCYAVADDGTTKTMNWWHVGMMALCQTFNVKAGESENLANRYYWRMVVGVGQEKIEGKLYDYVILSNIKEFQGNLLTVPSFADKTLANEQSKKLVWGDVMVEITMDKGMQTLASLFQEQEGKDVDDNGNKIADRIFYGYDGEKPDVPAPYDVIVQVGDQIQWKKYGNVIKLSTSTEDNATDTAPAITMYHKLGAPHYTGSLDANGNKIVNPYQWKIITTIISPEKVMHNTDNFQLFQGTPDNIVDPITIMYDIVPSVAYYTRHPSTQTTTPTDITFSLRKRTGNKLETLTDAQIYAEYTLLDGSSSTKLLTNKALSDIGDLYQITSVKLKSTIKEADHEDIVVTYDLPVLTDGVNGANGTDGEDGTTPTVVSTTYQYAITVTSAKPADSEWKSVMPDPSKYEGKFLWTKATTTWSTGDKTDTFSCTYIGTDGADGTSVTIKGTFGSISDLPTTGKAGDGYIIDGFLWVYTGTDTEDSKNHNGYTNVGKIKGEDGKSATQYYIHTAWMKALDGTGFTVENPNGDAYPYIGTLVDANEKDSTNWRDYKWTYVKGDTGSKGDKGDKGTDGIDGADGLDALEVTIKNAPLIFDTDDNGVVSSSAVQVAEIWLTRDGKNVIADIKNPSITDSLNFTIGSTNAVIRKTSECLQIVLKGIGITKETVNGNAVSKTSGYVVVSFDDGTNMFQRQIVFNVNVARFSSSVIQTAKLYEQKYTEVSNKYEALPEEVRNKESFTEYNSAIKQTAREISLSVTEEAAKKRNLLVNSDFARNGGFYFPKLASRAIVERLSGYEGENCVHTFASTVGAIPALTWGGNGNTSPNIPIIVGKKYTISCWVKVSNLSSVLCIKVFKQQSLTDSTGTATMLDKQITLDAENTWQLVTTTFEASGDYSYASVSIFVRPTANSRVDSYICRPMFEQADSYNGWTLSEEDYVYRNGNMLDNTRYLNKGGNLSSVGTITNNAKDNCSMSEASVDGTTSSHNLLSFANLSVQADTDYVLSFFARSKDIDSKANVGISLNLSSNIKFAEGSNRKVSSFTSSNSNSTTSGYIVYEEIPTDWTRFWYHFSAKGTATNQYLAIQVARLNGAGTLQICQPKLEKAVTNTAWTEAKQDVAFKDKVKRAGIDLDSETIRLSAERTIIDGDLHLKGILVENTAEPVKADFFPIVCDLKQNKSIAVGTYTGNENYSTGSEMRFVLLPMVYDVPCINVNGNETTVAGLRESGVKLTIFSKYNPMVAKWANAKRMRYRDSEKNNNNVWGEKEPYVILHDAITVVYADPRIAFLKNYTGSGTIYPESNGSPSYKDENNAGYKHGCFVCNGRRGRFLLLMPGQALHLTSSIERWGNEDVLMWYVDNASEFVPISKNVRFYDSNYNPDLEESVKHQYEWDNVGYSSNHDSSFPGDTLSALSNYVYEDVLFAPPQLSNDYPADDAWGMNVVKSGVSLSIPLF